MCARTSSSTYRPPRRIAATPRPWYSVNTTKTRSCRCLVWKLRAGPWRSVGRVENSAGSNNETYQHTSTRPISRTPGPVPASGLRTVSGADDEVELAPGRCATRHLEGLAAADDASGRRSGDQRREDVAPVVEPAGDDPPGRPTDHLHGPRLHPERPAGAGRHPASGPTSGRGCAAAGRRGRGTDPTATRRPQQTPV